MLLAVCFILRSSSLPSNVPANPTANSKITSSIIHVSHAHAACLFSQNFTATRESSPTPPEVSTTTFLNPATAAVELVETTVEVERIRTVWLVFDSLLV